MITILVRGVEVRLDHRGGEREAFALVGIDENALAAGEIHDVLIRDPVRDGDHHFIAGIDQRLRQVEDDVLAADRDQALGGLVGGAEILRVALADGLLQFERCRRPRCTW